MDRRTYLTALGALAASGTATAYEDEATADGARAYGAGAYGAESYGG